MKQPMAASAHTSWTTAIGTAVVSPAIPTSGEATAPSRKVEVPSSADAEPAACGVRISAWALVFGIARPIDDISTNRQAATGTRPTSPKTPADRASSAVAASGDHRQPHAEHLVHADAADQDAAVDLAHADEADRVEPEEQAEGLRRGAVDLLDDEGRTGDIGEEGGEGEAAREHVAGEDAVGEQPAHRTQRLAEPAVVAALRGQGLAQEAPDDEGEQRADHGQDDEDAAPVGEAQDLAADHGRGDGRDTGDQHQGGEEAGHRDAVVQVADDGAGDHDPGRPGEPLEQPEADEQSRRWARRRRWRWR